MTIEALADEPWPNTIDWCDDRMVHLASFLRVLVAYGTDVLCFGSILAKQTKLSEGIVYLSDFDMTKFGLAAIA